MTNSPIAVLLVEDNPGDARLVQELLREAAPARFALTHLPRLDAALAHLQAHSPDAILLDLSLPDGHGAPTVARPRRGPARAHRGDERAGRNIPRTAWRTWPTTMR